MVNPMIGPSEASGATVPRAADTRPGLAGLTPDELTDWLEANGHSAYRGRQIADQLWHGRDGVVADLHTLPLALRHALDRVFRLDTVADSTVRVTDGGETEKGLHILSDGRAIESVLMRYPARGQRRERATICISSQAGCAVGCPFCATGELGFWRDLETAEIVDQVRFWSRRLTAEGRRITNVVFMGMGEPLLNVDAVLAAAQALTDPARFGLGARHITISTSGVVPGMTRMTELGPQFTLAVSLHAARTALRDLLVPLNRRWPAETIVAAAAAYSATTGRRVTYEYVMIDGINDTPQDATETAQLLKGHLAHVNLIPMNPVAHTPWRPSRPERIEAFANILRSVGLHTTVRRNRGVEIGAACGQLAAERGVQPTPAAVARRQEALIARSAIALGRSPTDTGAGTTP